MLIRLDQFSKVEKIFRSILDSYTIKRDHQLKMLSLLNLANVFKCKQSNDKSLITLREAGELMSENNQLQDLPLIYNNIARLSLKERKYNKGEKYFKAAEELCSRFSEYQNTRVYLCQNMQGKAAMHLKRKDYVNAQLCLMKCLQIQKGLYLNGSKFAITSHNIQRELYQKGYVTELTEKDNINYSKLSV